MKNKSILLMSVLSMSMTAYSMNLVWLGKLKPIVSRVASVACNYIQGHKAVSGAVASAALMAMLPRTRSLIANGFVSYAHCLQKAKNESSDWVKSRVLHCALICGARPGVVKKILDMGVDLNAVVASEPLLYTALRTDNVDIVRLFCHAGANKDDLLNWAVIRSSQNSDTMVRLLCDEGANPNLLGGDETPLFRAIRNGRTEKVRILVKAGANKEAVDSHGDTPLHKAVVGGNTEIVRILVQAGANKEAVDGFGDTPLHLAVTVGNAEIVSILVQAGANIEALNRNSNTPLCKAVKNGNTEIVRILAQAGANKEDADWSGYTPLHWAVTDGNAEIVRILVQAGANIVPVDGNARTLRALAQAEQRQEIIDYLDMVPQMEQEMHAAARAGNVGRVQELVAQGAPVLPGIVAALGEYNLQAPSRQHGEIARLLLKVMGMRQAARAKGADGRTLLHVAAACGNTKFAEVLARYGADVNAVDVIGNTPLHVAKSAEMNGILLQYKARTDVMNVDGKVPFSAQINQWMPWFRKWVEEDKKNPALFTGTVQD